MRHATRAGVLVLVLGALVFAAPRGAAAGPGEDESSAETVRKAQEQAREMAVRFTDLLGKLVREGRTEEAKETLATLERIFELQTRLDALAAKMGGAPVPAPTGEKPKLGPEPDDVPPPGKNLAGSHFGGAGGAFGSRGGHRNLRAEGGGAATQQGVDLGLEWLKNHQDPDGFWDCDGYMKMCTLNTCEGAGYALYDPGVTGLATLAFLAAGETHRQGNYKTVVKNALAYLKKIQDPEGCFGPRTTNHYTYNHAIDTLAMAEAYAMTGSPLFRQSAQQGVDFVLKAQNPYLAWRYGVRPQDNDTSVSGWMIAALKSAKAAGLKVDPAGFDGMKAWLDKVTEPEFGRVGYTARGTGPARPQDVILKFPSDKSESLTAVGIYCRILIGENPHKSEMIMKGTDLCLKTLPVWDPQAGTIDMYYWYYGTLAMFEVGGDAWKQWNEAMKPAILDHQRTDGDQKGSWDPVGPWGREGGRIYSTALMTMCLEVYYRYARVFGGR